MRATEVVNRLLRAEARHGSRVEVEISIIAFIVLPTSIQDAS